MNGLTWPKTESHVRFSLFQCMRTVANTGSMIIGTVGISKYAADALGDVVYIELPALGDEATAEEALGTVESVKSASDVLSPVSGTITSVNEALADTPA